MTTKKGGTKYLIKKGIDEGLNMLNKVIYKKTAEELENENDKKKTPQQLKTEISDLNNKVLANTRRIKKLDELIDAKKDIQKNRSWYNIKGVNTNRITGETKKLYEEEKKSLLEENEKFNIRISNKLKIIRTKIDNTIVEEKEEKEVVVDEKEIKRLEELKARKRDYSKGYSSWGYGLQHTDLFFSGLKPEEFEEEYGDFKKEIRTISNKQIKMLTVYRREIITDKIFSGDLYSKRYVENVYSPNEKSLYIEAKDAEGNEKMFTLSEEGILYMMSPVIIPDTDTDENEKTMYTANDNDATPIEDLKSVLEENRSQGTETSIRYYFYGKELPKSTNNKKFYEAKIDYGKQTGGKKTRKRKCNQKTRKCRKQKSRRTRRR